MKKNTTSHAMKKKLYSSYTDFDVFWNSSFLFKFSSLLLYLSVCLSVCLMLNIAVSLSVCLSICLSTCLSVCQSVCLSIYVSACFAISPADLSLFLSLLLHLHVTVPSDFRSTVCSTFLPHPGSARGTESQDWYWKEGTLPFSSPIS